jgi:hypothetical protein
MSAVFIGFKKRGGCTVKCPCSYPRQIISHYFETVVSTELLHYELINVGKLSLRLVQTGDPFSQNYIFRFFHRFASVAIDRCPFQGRLLTAFYGYTYAKVELTAMRFHGNDFK